jgi:hypothetical protein
MDQSLSYASENEQFAFSFLARYGEMIHAQEAEDQATISHVRPIFHTIQRLGGGATDQRQSGHGNQASMIKETSFTANADDTYMQGTSRHGVVNDSIVSTPPPSSVATSISYDDKLAFETMRRFKDAPVILGIEDSKDYEVLKTDQQLCLVLKTMVESSDYRHHPDAGITFAEFVHVYKIAVSGMQALQMLPTQGRNKSSDSDRKRTWGRCLVMMESFSHFDVARIEDSNYSIVSNDDDDDHVLNKTKLLEGFEGREFETNTSRNLEVVRERKSQIARLMDEVSVRKRRSNVLLSVLLLALAVCVGLGYYQVDHWHGAISTDFKNSENIKEPVATENVHSRPVSDNLVGDLVITLAQTQEELNAAKTQVGSMVLDMVKVNNQLATCLSSKVEQGTERQNEFCAETAPAPTALKSQTANIESKDDKPWAPAVRRQIATVLGTAAIMTIPSFLPVKILQRFASIFARFMR